jgi:hypothetical protein
MGISSFTGNYGEVIVYRLRAGESKVTWFASSKSNIEIGGVYKVKATIKRHEEYRGEKVTMITRVKVLETVQNGAEAIPA